MIAKKLAKPTKKPSILKTVRLLDFHVYDEKSNE
jgi:hypothetical protein